MLIRLYMGLLLAIGTALSACEPATSIKRLTYELIEQKKNACIHAQEKNSTLRKVVGVGSSCLGVIALLGGGYAYYKRGTTREGAAGAGARALFADSFEGLAKRVAQLESERNGPNFGSMAWIKSTAWSILLSPSGIMSVLEILGKVGKVLCNKIFYTPTVSWYINEHTKNLGKIVEKSDQNSLVSGSVVQELERNAQVLDESAKSIMPVDHDYYRRRIIGNFNKIVEDMAGLIAFMQYRSCCFTKPPCTEASERARYLFNYTNQMSDLLEHTLALSQDQSKKQLIVPFIKGFFIELEQVLVSFMRIEQEYL